MAGESTTGNGSATMGNVGNHAAMGNGQPNHNGSLASPVPFLRCCNEQCESESATMRTVKVKVQWWELWKWKLTLSFSTSCYFDFLYHMIENIDSDYNNP